MKKLRNMRRREKRHKSLSNIIEDYLSELTKESECGQTAETKIQDLAPITKSLAGLLKGKEHIDIKEDKIAYLRKKHDL
ncbi:toxin-antitoxin system, antitoxin component [Leptospira mayottensis]|uniref:Toxin-antitoxin system, antitoxin component, ribbon-helix-helix domain protein n=3 Tax=Leptospira mayottensis TaxID=1137606 RepID=A0AA87SXR3_9LEPT|nr:DUF6364 family protein [Leptospira mayottensis]AZQ02881.1 toxin-antitoxin system, antitoxin component [Leptospira mayottensis 200901116]AXR60687.1 toxin-antitoxin system, antitoxin component [Leptospira mayottensis]AXR64551.1 toxin-antitoxin system, antitoxin component [Leptospira mayottensis]EKR98563.1 putative toxin-antitoxin system, antitoxin component, ribbon-helix-helix domain protein [Leptospira mayottensis 200901122]TGM95708.1 toxin-antitoxin system, antitoxin component [Leptospira m